MSEETNKGVIKRGDREANSVKQRTNHLLIIGIDNYSNGIAKLNNAVKDAENFRDLLLDQYQFDASNVTTLFNEEATLTNIRKTFSKILNELTTDDNLIFYYSGHGEQRPYGKSERGYWIPYDAVLGEDYTYLPNEEINNLFKNSHAHHVFGIVDSCYSGSLFNRRTSNANDRISSYPSRWLLTAGRLEPVSDGSLGANSPFATALFTYLKNNPNDSFWVSELCTQVTKGMDYNTQKQTPRGEALQDAAHYGGQFVFYKKGYIPKVEEGISTISPLEHEPSKGLETKIDNSPTTLEELKSFLKKLTGSNLEEALNQFEKYLSKSSSKENDLILQQGSFNRNKNQITRGVITEANAAMTEARIRYALLSYIDDLEAEDVIF